MTRVYPVHHFLLFPKRVGRAERPVITRWLWQEIRQRKLFLSLPFGNSKKWWTGEIPCHLFPHSFSKVFSNSLRTQDKRILCEPRTKKMIVETKSRKAVVNIPLFAVPSQLRIDLTQFGKTKMTNVHETKCCLFCFKVCSVSSVSVRFSVFRTLQSSQTGVLGPSEK